MPSSSSSDEDLEKFKEAADSSLYNDSLFIKNEVLEQKSVSAVLPSLRYAEEEGGGGDQVYNKLHVTPAFQKHVANKLSKLFDSHLEIDGDTTVTSRNVLQATRRKPLCNSEDDSNRGGVRLFGASAVFLSSMNIVPLPPYKRGKRERKVASFTNGCDSSSDDSDNGNMLKMSAAAVSPSWVLSGEATKGWAHSKGKLERCKMDKAGCLIPISNGFEALDPDKSNTNFRESLNAEILSNLSSQNHRKKKKVFKIDTELAASFSSVVSIGSDSQCDTSSKPRKPEHKKKKKKKKKKRSKEHYSEDAATETTEVEEAVERRKKKLKRAHKKTKYLRVVERVSEEIQMINECVPGLLEDENDIGSRRRQKKHKVKRLRATREYFLKSKRCCLHTPSKKKLRNNIRHLSDDLAKLMMTPSETSQD